MYDGTKNGFVVPVVTYSGTRNYFLTLEIIYDGSKKAFGPPGVTYFDTENYFLAPGIICVGDKKYFGRQTVLVWIFPETILLFTSAPMRACSPSYHKHIQAELVREKLFGLECPSCHKHIQAEQVREMSFGLECLSWRGGGRGESSPGMSTLMRSIDRGGVAPKSKLRIC